jgi:hypothetical protein
MAMWFRVSSTWCIVVMCGCSCCSWLLISASVCLLMALLRSSLMATRSALPAVCAAAAAALEAPSSFVCDAASSPAPQLSPLLLPPKLQLPDGLLAMAKPRRRPQASLPTPALLVGLLGGVALATLATLATLHVSLALEQLAVSGSGPSLTTVISRPLASPRPSGQPRARNTRPKLPPPMRASSS